MWSQQLRFVMYLVNFKAILLTLQMAIFFLFSLLSYKIEMPSKLQILDVMAYYKVCCDNWTCGSCFSFTSNRAVTQLM